MNLPNIVRRLAAAVFTLFAGFILIPAGRAQSVSQISDSRFLFIFDTSADMKKRLPAVQAEMNELMSTSLSGQLRPGNSFGVWTFDQDLRTGQFPLQHWNPDDAAAMTSGINAFVGKQRYANGTRFNALQPPLDRVIHNSARLTVLIFCDGEDEIKWTPYDAGINQVFQQRLAEQKKTRQPFVLVLRTQFGQYAGCTVNFPPGMVSFPEFPPLPAPAPANPPPPTPVVPPQPVGPPLIIIGRKVETNWPPAPAPSQPTNPAPVAPANIVSITPTNPVVPPLPTNPAPALLTKPVPPLLTNPAPVLLTNVVPATPTNIVSAAPTNSAVPPPPENSGPAHKGAFVIGGALLIAAGTLATLAFFRSRRIDRSSLITRSMKKD